MSYWTNQRGFVIPLTIIPLDLSEANGAIQKWHRHHKPAVGHRFSLGCINNDGELVGVAICSRPIARRTDQKFVLEITRLATDGTFNACSILLGAAAKTAKILGYAKIQTTTLQKESGSSLKAVGWEYKESSHNGSGWNTRDRNVDCTYEKKIKWWKDLNPKPEIMPISKYKKNEINTRWLFGRNAKVTG